MNITEFSGILECKFFVLFTVQDAPETYPTTDAGRDRPTCFGASLWKESGPELVRILCGVVHVWFNMHCYNMHCCCLLSIVVVHCVLLDGKSIQEFTSEQNKSLLCCVDKLGHFVLGSGCMPKQIAPLCCISPFLIVCSLSAWDDLCIN